MFIWLLASHLSFSIPTAYDELNKNELVHCALCCLSPSLSLCLSVYLSFHLVVPSPHVRLQCSAVRSTWNGFFWVLKRINHSVSPCISFRRFFSNFFPPFFLVNPPSFRPYLPPLLNFWPSLCFFLHRLPLNFLLLHCAVLHSFLTFHYATMQSLRLHIKILPTPVDTLQFYSNLFSSVDTSQCNLKT